jgi:hypothetical protein
LVYLLNLNTVQVLLWPTYTNIGIDERNHLDYVRAMPGGLNTTRKMVKELKSSGVRVLWPYNPWDIYTRDEGSPDWVALNQLIKDTAADGFNGDTMPYIPENFYTQSVKDNWPIAMEPEGGGDEMSINW